MINTYNILTKELFSIFWNYLKSSIKCEYYMDWFLMYSLCQMMEIPSTTLRGIGGWLGS